MGFFDRLFGGLKSPAAVDGTTLGFRDVGGWIEGRLGEINRLKRGRAAPVLEKIKGILAELSDRVDDIEQQRPEGIPQRLVKVALTSKPGYLKKMRKTIEALGEGASRKTGAADYNVLLKEKLDAIGKINLGEGRYLTAVFGEAMGEIQATCKRLYEQHERLAGMMKPSEEEKRLMAVRDRLAQFDEVKASLAELKEGVSLLKSNLSGEKKTLDGKNKALDGVLKEINGPEIQGVREGLAEAEGALNTLEQQILNHIGRIKRGLRKYAKYSAVDAQPINALLECPVDGFLAMDEREFTDILSRVRSAVEEKKVSLKDRDKALGRFDDAGKTLTENLREKHRRLSKKTAELKEELGGIEAFKKEKEIRQGIRESEEEIKRLTKALEKDGGRLKKTGGALKKLKGEIAENLAGLGVELAG